MNSGAAAFREHIRLFQQQHPLFQSVHPFWQDCFRGRLDREDIRLWARDVYPVIRDFARLYVHVAAKCDSEQTLTFLGETIFEETGSGVEQESHPTLFRNFLQALGVTEDELPAGGITGAGRDHWEFCWDIARDDTFIGGLTLVGIGIERPLPVFFQMIARAFERHHGLDAAALKYFAVHTVADVKHSQLASRIVSERARSAAEQARVREVLFELWDRQQRQMDAIHELARNRRGLVATVGD